MIIRKTTEKDIDEAKEIYDLARSFMRDTGNREQWSDGHPNGEDLVADVLAGNSYVVEDEGEIVAVFYFSVGDDPTYSVIYDGAWLSDSPYAVIHRVAVKYHGKGIAGRIFSHCFAIHPNLRIDTHRDNLPMQRTLAKAGFVRCGTVYLENGEARLAYQKL